MGDIRLEPGEYSLWSVPHENDDFDLIINSQANVWGTNHDPAFDLHTIPLTVEQLESPVEQFTIELNDRLLSLSWANMKASVSID